MIHVNLEQRKNNRIVFSVPVRYKVFELENLEKDVQNKVLNQRAEIENLSVDGIQVVSERSFKTGDILEVELEISGAEKVRTVAKVAWSRPRKENEKEEFCSGVQFIPVFEDDLRRLEEYLRSRKEQ
jgi:Tfp pilus assembly protein PilZ